MSKVFGSATYAVATLATLAHWRHKRLRVTVDGHVKRDITGQGIVVANCQYYGGGMWVAPGARPDDGLFDVIVEGSIGKVRGLLKAPKLYKGTHFKDRYLRSKLELLRGTRVDVDSPDRVLVQLDGEVVGWLPARFEIVPGALRIMVPRS
jgi:diacylglycerol kinase family enzyme